MKDLTRARSAMVLGLVIALAAAAGIALAACGGSTTSPSAMRWAPEIWSTFAPWLGALWPSQRVLAGAALQPDGTTAE